VVYCVQAELAFSSSARRNSVLSDIESRISTRERWGVDVIQMAPLRSGANGIRLELRFTSRLDADDLMARIESFATGQRRPLAGSWLTVHNCTHDSAASACVPDARRDW
jgi:hypothetical protein